MTSRGRREKIFLADEASNAPNPARAGNISSGWYGWSFSQTYCRYAHSATR
jgi:hypothetical protein